MSVSAEERIAFARDQVERGVRAVGALHPDAIMARMHYGIALSDGGFNGLALDEFSRAAKDACSVLGATHPDALVARYHELSTLLLLGKAHEAEVGLGRLLDDHIAVFGQKHVGTFSVRSQLANVLVALGRPSEAEEQLAMLLLEAEQSDVELEPGQRASWLLQHSRCLAETGRFDHAADVARDARRVAMEGHTRAAPLAIVAQALLIDALFRRVMSHAGELSDEDLEDLLGAGMFDLLEEMHRELEVLREDLGSGGDAPELTPGSQHWITVRLAEISAAGVVEDGAASAAAAQALGDELMLLRGPDPIALNAATRIGEHLGELGRVEEAVAFLEGVVEEATRNGLDRAGPVLVLRNNLGQWLHEVGRSDEAVAILRSTIDDAADVPEEPGVDRTTIARNLLEKASMVGDLDATRHAADILRGLAGQPEGAVDAPPVPPTEAREESAPGLHAERIIDRLASGTAPQAAEAVAEAVAACSVVGLPVLIERHSDGWCWALAASSMVELTSTLHSLEPGADGLPSFLLASSWIVRDGMTSWRPRPEAPRPVEWWVVPVESLEDRAALIDLIGGDR